jgi:hypothetical protein
MPIPWDDFRLPLPANNRGVLPALPDLIDDSGVTMTDLQTRATRTDRDLRLPPLRAAFDPFAALPAS